MELIDDLNRPFGDGLKQTLKRGGTHLKITDQIAASQACLQDRYARSQIGCRQNECRDFFLSSGDHCMKKSIGINDTRDHYLSLQWDSKRECKEPAERGADEVQVREQGLRLMVLDRCSARSKKPEPSAPASSSIRSTKTRTAECQIRRGEQLRQVDGIGQIAQRAGNSKRPFAAFWNITFLPCLHPYRD